MRKRQRRTQVGFDQAKQNGVAGRIGAKPFSFFVYLAIQK